MCSGLVGDEGTDLARPSGCFAPLPGGGHCGHKLNPLCKQCGRIFDLVVALEAARTELAATRDALKRLNDAVSAMPDAGLTSDDPRYDWWFSAALQDAQIEARNRTAG